MPISARNQFQGTVTSVKHGAVMSEVVIDIGGREIVSLISVSSAKRLKLKKGKAAVAIIKSTEVLISTDDTTGINRMKANAETPRAPRKRREMEDIP